MLKNLKIQNILNTTPLVTNLLLTPYLGSSKLRNKRVKVTKFFKIHKFLPKIKRKNKINSLNLPQKFIKNPYFFKVCLRLRRVCVYVSPSKNGSNPSWYSDFFWCM